MAGKDTSGEPAETSLDSLREAIESLAPGDLAAWAERVENRLTERLRQRSNRPRPAECPEEDQNG